MAVANVTPPIVSGTARVGSTLLTTPGTWTYDLDYVDYAYQWMRCDTAGANCVDISGATNASYILTSADLGSRIRSEVTATEHTGSYWNTDYAGGVFDDPWTLLFSYAGDGTHDTPTASTPDGRVAIVANPDGPGNAARFEIRDADPGWPPKTSVQKSEARSTSSYTWDKSQVAYGDERWFSEEIYLPYTGTEKFEWAHGSGDPYTVFLELHTASSTGWSAFRMGFESWQIRNQSDANRQMAFSIFGGAVHSTDNFESIPLWALCDGSGNRVMANHNRWIELVWGMKFAPDNTGWIEVWVDGSNVYPRENRPTMWVGDFGMYYKHGLYKKKDSGSVFPESGKSVIYFGRTTIGLTQP